MKTKAVERSAPGKVILCGEHSVVYGRPAIAVPVRDLRARVRVEPGVQDEGLYLVATNLKEAFAFGEASDEHPLAKAVRLVLNYLQSEEPDAVLTVESDLPIASGLGSGAAVTVATVRALSAFLDAELPRETVNEIAYEVEKIHHGTPSGIDNTVVSWESPVYFVRERSPELFEIGLPFHLLIANSGIASSTREAVAEVHRRWIASLEYYEILFNCIGALANAARAAVEQGALQALGILLNENHRLLINMGVSLMPLDRMVQAARDAGALGAKLTGAGQGGNVIALVEPESLHDVKQALRAAGALQVWHTQVGGAYDE